MKFLFLLLAFFVSSIHAQTDTLYYKKDYKKATSKVDCYYWRIVDYSDSTFVSYYNTGEVCEKGKFLHISKEDDVDSSFDGDFFEFYESGRLKGVYHFSDGFLDGEYVTYYRNGNTNEFGTFKHGEEHGLIVKYSDDGKKSEAKYYTNGVRNDVLSEPYRIAMALGGGEPFHINTGKKFDIETNRELYRKFNEYIKEFDATKRFLDETVAKYGIRSSNVFWNALVKNNPAYNKFYSEPLSKKKKKEIELFKSKAEIESCQYDGFPTIFYGSKDEALYRDFILFLQGYNPPKSIKFIYLTNEKGKNAYAYPDGTICVTIPLFNELSAEELLGVLAHEMAHYMLDHAVVSEIKVKKKKKANTVWSVVLAGINTVASAAVEYKGGVAKDNHDEYWENVNRNNENIINGFKESSILYEYRYSREQEMEADIVAYRFLEYMGYDPRNYINALGKIVGFNINNPSPESISALSYDHHNTNKYSDHPSILERCLMLEYIELYDRKQLTTAKEGNR